MRKRWSSLGRKTVSDTPVVRGFPFRSHVTLTSGGENLSMKQMRVLGSPSSTGLFGNTVTSGGTGGHGAEISLLCLGSAPPSLPLKRKQKLKLCRENLCHSLWPYHPERARSRLISEAKQGRAWLVLGWENLCHSLRSLSLIPSPIN